MYVGANKLHKGLSIIFVLVALLITNAAVVQAVPKVILDGNQLSFDVSPTIENGRTLVPLRAIFEALGADVNWDGVTQTVTATNGNAWIELQIGATTVYKNGSPVSLDVPAKIINNRTLVPLLYVL